MNYIIFDLEWNNVYNYKTKQGTNEIIEIGAVKLSENLELVDTFNQLIMPQLSKKLGSRFTKLTGITKEEVFENGVSFDDAFNKFEQWCSDDENIFLSWSNSDLFTLISNFRIFRDSSTVTFMHNYADAQKYCMSFFDDLTGASQIGLSDCAQRLEIDTDDFHFHRAVEDCYVSALCFKKLYDEKKFSGFVNHCDYDYFERLTFKKYFISTPVCDDFNISDVELKCPVCKSNVIPVKDYEFLNNTFRGAGQCIECKRKFWLYVRAKKTYDEVIVSKRLVAINKKRAKYI